MFTNLIFKLKGSRSDKKFFNGINSLNKQIYKLYLLLDANDRRESDNNENDYYVVFDSSKKRFCVYEMDSRFVCQMIPFSSLNNAKVAATILNKQLICDIDNRINSEDIKDLKDSDHIDVYRFIKGHIDVK